MGEEAFSVPGRMALLSLLLALWEEALEEKCVKRPLASSDCSKIVLVSLRPVRGVGKATGCYWHSIW